MGAVLSRAALPFDLVSSGVDEPIRVEEWNPAWWAAADDVAAECRAVLGDQALSVEHVGSTAVRGLAAKPVIDILVGVPAGRRIAVARHLASQGWTHLGEAGVPGREYLRRREGQHANISVVEHGSTLWQDNLLLRDYLRRSPDARRRYAAAKRRAAQEAPTLLAYSEHKAVVVAQLLNEARKGRGRYLHPRGHYNHEMETWLNPKLEVKGSPIQGRGLFAKEPLEDKERLVRIHPDRYVTMTDQEFREFREHAESWDAVALGDGLHRVSIHVREDEPANYANHSCSPNAEMDDEGLVAKRAINEAEELTCDYGLLSHKGWSMTCECGAPNCRGVIKGTR